MGINLQVTGFVSLEGSKKLNDAQRAALVGRTVQFEVNGVPVTGTLFVSKSGGLTARFAVKATTAGIGPKAQAKTEKPNTFDALAAAANSLLPSEGEGDESERDEQLGL
jgi:hypothetical protein